MTDSSVRGRSVVEIQNCNLLIFSDEKCGLKMFLKVTNPIPKVSLNKNYFRRRLNAIA